MGKKKQQQTTDSNYFNNQQQTASYDNTNENELGFAQVPTENWKAYNDLAGWNPTADPTIPFRYGAQRNRVASGYGNLAGGYSTPELGMARQMSALGEIGQEEGAASAADAARMSQQKLGQLGTLASLSAPVSYNKKSRSYGTSAGQGSGSGASHGMQTAPGGGSIFGSILGGLGAIAPFI